MGENIHLKPVGFFQLFKFASKLDVFLMVFGAIAAMVNGVLQPLMSQIIGRTTNQFSSNQDQSYIIENAKIQCFYMIGAGFISFICSWIQMACWMISGERQAIECRKQYFKAIIRQEIGWFDMQNPNELTSKISQDCFFIQGAIGEKVPKFLMAIFTGLGGFGVGFYNGWQMSLVSAAAAPIIIIGGLIYTIILQQTSIKSSEAYLHASAFAEQSLNSVKTVKSLTGENFEIKNYSEGLLISFKIATKYAAWAGFGLGLIFLTVYLDYSLCFWYGSKLMQDETINHNFGRKYTQGDIQTIFFAIQIAGFSLGQAVPCLKNFSSGQQAAAKIYDVLKRIPQIKNSDNPKILNQLKGHIIFKEVDFSYPSKKVEKVHNQLTLEIQPNMKTALVGESGCGKSTVMQLIERFYDPDSGLITVDGHDIRELDYVWLRKNIGYVGQEPVLYATTIRENLRFGKEDATEDEMINALKQAKAWEFIQPLKDKLDTYVGNSGSQFSGGQKQRICIARAILKDPQILLLDESTSALDRKNEAAIQATLDEVSKGRTTIVIAHRLSTVQNADRILVIEKGKLIEQGNYNSLINAGGKFEALAKNQIQKELEDNSNQNDDYDDNQLEQEKGEVKNQSQRFKQAAPLLQNKLEESTNRLQKQIPQEQQEQSQKKIKLLVDSEEFDLGQSQKDGKKQKNKPKFTSIQLIKKLIAINKPEINYFYAGLLVALINGAAQPVSGLLLGEYFDVLFGPSKSDFRERADMLTIYFVILAVVCLIGNLLQVIIFSRVGESLTLRMRKEVYSKLLKMPCSWFDQPDNNPGNLSTKLQQDGQYINQITSSIIPIQIQNLSCLVIGLALGFAYSWQITLIGMVATPLTIICAKFQAQFIQGYSENSDGAYKEAGQIIMESVTNIRTVASFCNEKKLSTFLSEKLVQPLQLVKSKGQISGVFLGFSFALIFWIYGIILYCGSIFTQYYDLSAKEMFVSIFSVIFAAFGIGYNNQFIPDIAMAFNSANSLFDILSQKDEVQICQEQALQLNLLPKVQQNEQTIQGNIEFRDVSFKYPSRDQYIFRNLSFKIQAGQKVAFVGPSGSGKSSIIQLLLRFYTNYEGEIFVDNKNLKEYHDLKSYRQNFGVVSQEPILFNATIQKNIEYNTENVTSDQIKQAAQQANALKFIEEYGSEEKTKLYSQNQENNQMNLNNKELGDGFQRKVGPKGSQLSGGQKQRIAIARAIIKNPNILLLDEATSALDPQNEKIVQEALDKLMKQKTSICIAHRLSTIQDSDKIYVIESGKLVEEGTYDQLMNKKEYFFRLNNH
ncbi:multidrug resistance protein-like transporter family ABC domain protein (macronuclear) [Tetrahymena thermophila SB210]|uniref:Multidrug resistance protein-like transporter family ABC domain protein n=1 Tax=Tetrahymena thermophila (strain SB210) TaxID=312017 RepID=A4VE58_TETTS|nr:multidrug resistance protein-like transporter family ABC domain protein [Tetrahymena thermophila SB210]EDK31811.1 multidrug resistance protein-like transporter family ABC domain protein [Tetrahymena thermophila SB210]|eukprot:XP_001471296.1 multidrug resistance protein-like transporter family ABC domain protein [Tetrahymena thermophila SB210]